MIFDQIFSSDTHRNKGCVDVRAVVTQSIFSVYSLALKLIVGAWKLIIDLILEAKFLAVIFLVKPKFGPFYLLLY